MLRIPCAPHRACKCCFAVFITSVALCGCAAPRDRSPEAAPVAEAVPAPAPAAPPVREQSGPPIDPPNYADAPAPTPAPTVEQADAAAPPPAKSRAAKNRRADGRPEWWIDGAVNAQGRMTVAAEAMGADVLSARRAAVDAGRALLQRAVKEALRDEQIIYTTVFPLPAKGGAPGGPKYVGYVLMSAQTPTED